MSAFSELLDAESRAWNEDLYWDFTSSARVISTCLKEKRLSGYALVLDGVVRGYCFFFCDGEKGLMGDLFVGPAPAGLDQVLELLEHANETLLATPGLRRVEAQLPHYTFEDLESNFTSWKYSGYRRRFMALFLPEWQPQASSGFGRFDPTRRAAPAWMSSGSCPAKRNTPARPPNSSLAPITTTSMRRSMTNTAHWQEQRACSITSSITRVAESFLSKSPRSPFIAMTRKLAGVLTVTAVRSDTAHIPQIAIARTLQGIGLGTALLESAFNDLVRAGYQRVSLTVTEANAGALRLYERLGFKTFRTFGAFVFNR